MENLKMPARTKGAGLPEPKGRVECLPEPKGRVKVMIPFLLREHPPTDVIETLDIWHLVYS